MSNKFFFSTRKDLEPGLRQIESQFKLKYILEGWHDTPDYEVFHSALEIPDLGQARFNYFTGTNKYLVASANSDIVVEAIPQLTGGIKYMIDFPQNENAFWFQPGGTFDGTTLVGGAVAANSLKPDVRKLYFSFARTITKGFTKVYDRDNAPWHVGPEAMDLLKSGVDLVTDSPHSLKLVTPLNAD